MDRRRNIVLLYDLDNIFSAKKEIYVQFDLIYKKNTNQDWDQQACIDAMWHCPVEDDLLHAYAKQLELIVQQQDIAYETSFAFLFVVHAKQNPTLEEKTK